MRIDIDRGTVEICGKKNLPERDLKSCLQKIRTIYRKRDA